LKKRTNSLPADKTRRRRRKPEAAETEILDAAEDFLKEFPFRDMTIDNVMARTGLSRPSFYEYFRDRSHLIVKLVQRLNERDRTLSARWFNEQDPVESLRNTTRELVNAYVSHGPLLRALSDASHADAEVEARYRENFAHTIEETGRRISEFVSWGAMSLEGLDPNEIATALLWMNERYLVERLGRQPQADPKVVIDTLVAIWLRVLHGTLG
jgi:TetR/AcrR family transcriptional regulator, ethionamide resistance regulator